jgi:hypothetical protein
MVRGYVVGIYDFSNETALDDSKIQVVVRQWVVEAWLKCLCSNVPVFVTLTQRQYHDVGVKLVNSRFSLNLSSITY